MILRLQETEGSPQKKFRHSSSVDASIRYLFGHMALACGTLVPQLGTEPARVTAPSPNYWITRGFL